MINLARDQQGGIDIAGIDHVGFRQQATLGESVLNRCRHLTSPRPAAVVWTSVIRFGLSASHVSVR